MKQIWIDYCSHISISLYTFSIFRKKLSTEIIDYIEWLEDKNTELTKTIKEDKNVYKNR